MTRADYKAATQAALEKLRKKKKETHAVIVMPSFEGRASRKKVIVGLAIKAIPPIKAVAVLAFELPKEQRFSKFLTPKERKRLESLGAAYENELKRVNAILQGRYLPK